MAVPQPKDWLKAAAQQLRLGDREVLAMLKDSFRDVEKELALYVRRDSLALGENVRRAQLEATRRALLAAQAKVFGRLGDVTSARRLRAASRAAGLSARADEALLRLAGAGTTGKLLYESAIQTSDRGIESALARMGLSKMPLAERIYRVGTWMNNRLDRLINSSLARNLNAREFAKEARDWFNPGTPGGVRYAAMRLARTEINNAFHATSVQRAVDTPWTTAMTWNLSGSHVVPDECNEYAAVGSYPPEEVPVKPHPQCMCYVTPENIEEDDFVEGFLAGEYDGYLDGELAKENERLGLRPTSEPTTRQLPSAAPTPIRTPPLTLRL